MIKSLIKVLLFVCFCFNLEAMYDFNSTIIPSEDGKKILKAEVKDSSFSFDEIKVKIYITTDGQGWQVVKDADGWDYELNIKRTGDRSDSSVDLLKMLLENGITDSVQGIKTQFISDGILVGEVDVPFSK